MAKSGGGCRSSRSWNGPYSFRGMRRKPGRGGGVSWSKKREKEDKFEEPRLFEEVAPERVPLPIVVRINVGKKASEEGWLILRSSTSSRRGRALLMETSFDLSPPLPLFLLLSPSLGLLRSRLSPCLACKRGTITSRTSLMRRWSLLLSVDESSFSLRRNLLLTRRLVWGSISISREKNEF